MPRNTYMIASLLDDCPKDGKDAECNTEKPLELIHKELPQQITIPKSGCLKLNEELPESSVSARSTGSQKFSDSLCRIPAIRYQPQGISADGSSQCLPCRPPPLPSHLQDLSPYNLSCLSQLITNRSRLIQMQQVSMQWSSPMPTIATSHIIRSGENSTKQFRNLAGFHHRQHRYRMTANECQTTVKKYRCDICNKTFSRSNTLVTHKRIHTGEKPFHCDHCGRAFRQPGNLTRHRLTHTTQARRFLHDSFMRRIAHKPNKMMTSKKQLSMYPRSTSRRAKKQTSTSRKLNTTAEASAQQLHVKPYVCSICEKAFNRASNLHTHMRTHSQVISSNVTVTQPLRPFER